MQPFHFADASWLSIRIPISQDRSLLGREFVQPRSCVKSIKSCSHRAKALPAWVRRTVLRVLPRIQELTLTLMSEDHMSVGPCPTVLWSMATQRTVQPETESRR